MTELDKQMDEMLIEIEYLKSDKYINGIKADAIEEAIKNNVTLNFDSAFTYYCSLKEFIKELRNK